MPVRHNPKRCFYKLGTHHWIAENCFPKTLVGKPLLPSTRTGSQERANDGAQLNLAVGYGTPLRLVLETQEAAP